MEAKTNPQIVEARVDEVVTKDTIDYKDGFENRTAEFEILKGLPIKAGFSWGSESGTMSYKWKAESEPAERVYARIAAFTNSLGVTYPRVVHALGVFEGSQEQIQALDSTDLEDGDETMIKANFVYTMDTKVALIIRPADCNVSILYAKTRDGRSIAGLVHSSGVSTNAGIPRLAIRHLIDTEDVDPSTIRIGITPGISRENYSISEEDDYKIPEGKTPEEIAKLIEGREKPKIIERNWKDNIDARTDDPKARRNVDILRATIMQYLEEGINPEQIEAYDVDTFASHENGVGFSHRYYDQNKSKNDDVNPGRFMVAVQLAA